MNTHAGKLAVAAILALCLCAGGCSKKPEEAGGQKSLRLSSGDTLAFGAAASGWEASGFGVTYAITKRSDGYQFASPAGTLTARTKDSKTKLYGPDGALRLKIKRDDDKIKVLRAEEDPQAWSIRLKGEGSAYKVKRGEKTLGKAKFYPDQKLIKAKDDTGAVLGRMSADSPSAAPAIAFMSELRGEDRLALFALFMLLGW
ncbi:MAG TPA: hypothetical protein PLG31_01480 [Spirochaetota bacterium]|nr:hypothetical protein [Spirochaetota bacterium]